jgi:diguanylate cyclase (GGDEF)-like protein
MLIPYARPIFKKVVIASVVILVVGIGVSQILRTAIDHLLYWDATGAAENWAKYVAENVTDIEEIADGQQPSSESMAFLIRTQQIRHVFGFEIINLRGNVQLTSDGSKISSVRGVLHSAAAARAASSRQPVISMKEGTPPVRPRFYSEAYLPVIVDGHPQAIVAAFVDLSEQRDHFRQTFLLAALALGLLISGAVGIPTVGWYRRTKEKQQADRRIRFLAHHDSLTGLANRAQLIEKLRIALSTLPLLGGRLAVHFIDLDRLKEINDTFGHDAGDFLLRTTAERLRAVTGIDDIVARLGGDEFVVVQTGVSGQGQVVDLAGRLVSAMTTPMYFNQKELIATASIGVAVAPPDGASVDELLSHADLALYRAKSDGRNTFCFFDLEMGQIAIERVRLELELREALAAGEFEVHYQPIVSIATGRKVGMEALARWRHPKLGLIPPDRFIPLAEKTGLINQLGEFVLRQACADAVKWPPATKVAVNLSAVQFQQPDLAGNIAGILTEAKLLPERLELEITESVLLQRSEKNISILHELRDLGVSIALDDFGTGFSSLTYLRTFPFDKIKIDRSFVNDLSQVDVCAAIVCAVASLGRSLDIITTAEGVETEEQLELLRAAGCTQAQGYLFGRPCPIANIDFDVEIKWAPAKAGAALTAQEIMLVRTSFALLIPIQEKVAGLFYDRLFAIAPELRQLFSNDLNSQKRKLMALLSTCVGKLQDFSTFAPVIKGLGARHVMYGAKTEHYAIVAEALMGALKQSLGDAFTPEVRYAWAKVYEIIAATMQAGAAEAALLQTAS